jgi:hypothetical protein
LPTNGDARKHDAIKKALLAKRLRRDHGQIHLQVRRERHEAFAEIADTATVSSSRGKVPSGEKGRRRVYHATRHLPRNLNNAIDRRSTMTTCKS